MVFIDTIVYFLFSKEVKNDENSSNKKQEKKKL